MVDTEEQERNSVPSGPLAITHNNQVKHTDHVLDKNLTFKILTTVPSSETQGQIVGTRKSLNGRENIWHEEK